MVKRALADLPGVDSVTADFKSRIATVKATEEFDSAKAVEAIIASDKRFKDAEVLP
ncbi:MAG: cation transporter [Planctomycetaceae bacterium]